jgi:hypothetical protein
MLSRMIDQDASHHLSSNRKEVSAIAPVYSLLNQSQVRLVYKRSCLQSVVFALTRM